MHCQLKEKALRGKLNEFSYFLGIGFAALYNVNIFHVLKFHIGLTYTVKLLS